MRKDVPHAKCSPICAIKESLQALWARAGNCINKVNDVSPDGDGNFSITGGDNVVIGSTQNGITIDTTGAVAYYTTDDTKLSIDNNDLKISTVGVASTADVAAVAADVTAAEGDILTLQGQVAVNTGDIVTETTNRQNADNTLQGNINTLSGTVTGLSTQIALKRDRSDTVGFYAYTHNGTTQNETVIEDGTTAATLPVRDANGRMHAADPASGATDKTLTTANWVSQTGSGRPNNLIHDSGDENLTGTKNNPTMGIGNVYIGGSTQRWIRVAYSTINDAAIYGYVVPDKLVGIAMSCEFYLIGRTNNSIFKIRQTIYENPNPALFALTYDGTNYELWYYYDENSTNRRCTFCIRGANGGRPFTFDGLTTKSTLNPADYVYLTTPTVIS